MNVHLNGKLRKFDDVRTLFDLINGALKDHRAVVVEMNGEIINRKDWTNIFIKEGDKIELVSLVAGG